MPASETSNPSLPKPTRSFERAGASVQVFHDAATAAPVAAEIFANTIASAIAQRGKAVLGLATGGTPVLVYEQLVKRHKAGNLSFANVTSYNLDEYYPIAPFDRNSYRFYMTKHLFDHEDIAPNRAHVLDGTVPETAVDHCTADFDHWIEADGGLDLQFLGIGRNGHIGFNEPTDLPLDKALELPTRRVSLHPTTVSDAIKDFGSEEAVIRHALTVGISPILAARSVLILAFGSAKADAVGKALQGPISPSCPASLLQTIPGKVTWLVDEAAAANLA